MNETTTASLRTELTVKRAHFPFVYAACKAAGWDVAEEIEGVTTDEGYDHEVKLHLTLTVPLSALAEAPSIGDMEASGWDRLAEDLKLLA